MSNDARPDSRASSPRTEPARDLAELWSSIERSLRVRRRSLEDLGVRPPAHPALLKKASAAGIPASLSRLHALHDGAERLVECLGLGRVLWWPLATILEEGQREGDGRTLWTFAAPLEDEEDEGLPITDEHLSPGEDLDAFFAVDAETEEVVFHRREVGWSVEAPHLGHALERTVAALEAGATFDGNGRLIAARRAVVERPPPPPPPPKPPAGAQSVFIELATALVKKGVIELREGVTAEELGGAFAAALASRATESGKRGAVRAVFDQDLVDEVFARDDELDDIAKSIVARLA